MSRSMKLGTNLKPCEILALEAAGFQLPQKVTVSPSKFFSTSPSSANLDSVPLLADADKYPKKREAKIVKRTATCPNAQQRPHMGSSKLPESSTPLGHDDSSPWP